MADLTKVQQAVRSVAVTHAVPDLTARQVGGDVEIHGRVRTLAQKQSVMYDVTQAVGDQNLKNMLTVSADLSEFASA